jgi:glycosyltransferase involved in cell wall biosynthesis
MQSEDSAVGERGERVREARAEGDLPERNSVSACLVVRNEEAVIERCLRSLAGVVDEIVLVHDGECEDATLQIAERYGCRIYVRPLTGHAEATTIFAFEEARGEWIVSLDADEYLSDELRAKLRELVGDEGVNGYELLWRQWDGQRYFTKDGPYKTALFRRARVHVLGIHHSAERVDPPVKRLDLQLEHRPLYNNFAARTVLTKWRRSAKIHAEQLLSDFAELPKFNWDGGPDWPWQRRLLNVLSPLLFLPYVPVVFAVNFVRERDVYSTRENLRLSLYQGLYAGMLQFYIAKYKYLGLGQSPATEAPRPGAAGARPLA